MNETTNRRLPYPHDLAKIIELKDIHTPHHRTKPGTRRILFLLSLLTTLFIAGWQTRAQDPLRFKEEIAQLKLKNDSLWEQERPTQVFTGSSSIRMWKDLQDRFPGHQILNTGFGGSQASDLQYYLDVLVLDYRPEKVFIYEGDNDLAEGKKPKQVLRTLQEITDNIHMIYPGVPIVLISAKPSISRWNLRRKYRRFNRKLEKWTAEYSDLFFADVWNPMLEGRRLDESLFIEDGLHMTQKGYDIWEEILQPHLGAEPY